MCLFRKLMFKISHISINFSSLKRGGSYSQPSYKVGTTFMNVPYYCIFYSVYQTFYSFTKFLYMTVKTQNKFKNQLQTSVQIVKNPHKKSNSKFKKTHHSKVTVSIMSSSTYSFSKLKFILIIFIISLLFKLCFT